MQEDVRASLDDLAIRWETPRGRELKKLIVEDARKNRGDGIAELLKDFLYVNEVPHGRDLRCITLEDQDLSDCQFGKVDMSWASVARSKLMRADLREANLKRADLSGADLTMAQLNNIDGSRADFSRAQLDGARFKDAKLTGSVFEESVATRASFESGNLAKSNFRGANLDQANFFNADCNNANFDASAMETLAAKPAKAWGLRFDLEREDFEKQVGLRAITSRSTKQFKGLEALLAAQLPTDQADEVMDDDPGSGEIFFGTTKRLKPVPTLDDGDFIPAPGGAADASGADAAETGVSGAGTSGAGAEDSNAAPSEAGGSEEGGPGVTAEGDGEDDPYGDDPYADGPEDDDPERPTRAMRQTASRPRRPRGARPGSGLVRRPTARMTRPLGPGLRPRRPTQVLRRPAGPPSPVAPLDPNAPPALEDWAQAIGRLMTLKGSITKIVVETGDKSHVLFKTGGSE